MGLPAFNADLLKKRLIKIDQDGQLAFGAICVERILPNYAAFKKDTDWGEIAPLRRALDLAWSTVIDKTSDAKTVKFLFESCESVAPDTEIFDSLYASLAQDVCIAACNLLSFMLEYDVNKIVWVATYATDSVDLYVQETEAMDPNVPGLEMKILDHYLMQRELGQQEKNLNFIEQATIFDSSFINDLKQSWDNEGKSNLDLN